MGYYVGLDVSMKETFICVMDKAGKIIKEGRSKTDPVEIADHLKKLKLDLTIAGIESGSLSQWLVDGLTKLSIPVICIDSRKMATIIALKVNKTDKNDARSIADAMRCEMYKRVSPKSKESLEMNTLIASRRLMVEQKVQLSNTIRGLLKTYGIRFGSCRENVFVKKVKELPLDGCSIAKEGIKRLLNCYEHLLEELEVTTKTIEEIAQKDEEIKRLMTIPGIGLITATSYKSEIDDPKRFKNARAVGAYLGMTPRQYSSGDTIKQGKISRCGSKEVRFLLNEAAAVVLSRSKQWSKLKAWGLKIQRKHGFKKGAMAVGRKLAVIMYRMLVDKTDFIPGEPKEEKIKQNKERDGAIGLARAI